MDKLNLIKELLKLIEEEKDYKEQYDREYKRVYQEDKNVGIAGWEREKFRNMRVPTKATTTDALKIISRLSMQLSK